MVVDNHFLVVNSQVWTHIALRVLRVTCLEDQRCKERVTMILCSKVWPPVLPTWHFTLYFTLGLSTQLRFPYACIIPCYFHSSWCFLCLGWTSPSNPYGKFLENHHLLWNLPEPCSQQCSLCPLLILYQSSKHREWELLFSAFPGSH